MSRTGHLKRNMLSNARPWCTGAGSAPASKDCRPIRPSTSGTPCRSRLRRSGARERSNSSAPRRRVALLPMCFPRRFSGKQIQLKSLIFLAYPEHRPHIANLRSERAGCPLMAGDRHHCADREGERRPCDFALRQGGSPSTLNYRGCSISRIPLLPKLLPKRRLRQSAESFGRFLICALEPLGILAEHYSRIMPAAPGHDVNAHAPIQ